MRTTFWRGAGLLVAMAVANLAEGAAAEGDPIEGVWDFTVTRRDCAGGAVLGVQKALSVFHRGGTLSNDNSTPPESHGAMFGTWRRGSGAAYAVHMMFMRFNADGTLAGTQKVVRTLTLAADGNGLTGTVVARTLDTTAAVTAEGCATETGVRAY